MKRTVLALVSLAASAVPVFAADTAPQSAFGGFVPLIVIFVIFYFLLITKFISSIGKPAGRILTSIHGNSSAMPRRQATISKFPLTQSFLKLFICSRNLRNSS